MATERELETLKLQWEADPCWDLEDTDGFEEHRTELLVHKERQEQLWAKMRTLRMEQKAEQLGIPGNLRLVAYINGLESHLVKREELVSA